MGFFSNVFKSKQEILSEKRSELTRQKGILIAASREKLTQKENDIPLLKARNTLASTLTSYESKRHELNAQWKAAYENFSWWNKLKYDEKLDLSDLDSQIRQLKRAVRDFDEKYQSDLVQLDTHFLMLRLQSEERIKQTYSNLVRAVEKGMVKEVSKTSLSAAWLATLSVPVSIANDSISADLAYDALRSVNSNFEGMNNYEIWWETLWMSPESHAGLVNLTKGAYFEQLVANDTGGQLHEHFNNPDTDIVIDGVEVQLKATDSASYINSVDDEIPIIATSEVAASTAAIDSGYTNEEITNTVELALGGSVIDAKDTAVDMLLTGVGSLGVFATLRGINHASDRYNKGVDGVEAIFEGAGVAIEGTAKGIVDASEMVYKVAMSRPSRFVGRTLLKGLKKLDDKMMEAASKEGKK
ncbi:hypothetical protein [Shewanella marisflavi]|uniref:hypothetical protein n=1 Tax=Shewanella marisflavi TaxID=260364 RepID=UPI003AAC14A1